MKFSEWFEKFHSVYCVGVISYDKQKEYSYIFKKHYYPIADMELCDIKPIDIQRCINTAQDYCYQRKRDVYFLLKRVFREAICNEYMEKNPTDHIKAPKKIRKFVETFNGKQLEMLFDSDTRLSRMFEFEVWTGLRRGEILALTWDNVDLENKLIYVCKTLVNTANGGEIQNTTKSRRDRVIPLNDRAIQILSEVYKRYTQTGFVFVSENGNPISLRNYTKLFHKFFAQQQEKYPELIYLSPHKLRHSFATNILKSGADIDTTRELLGHVDISTTQRYIHSDFEQMRDATDRLHFV